jgi:hypothetical protein
MVLPLCRGALPLCRSNRRRAAACSAAANRRVTVEDAVRFTLSLSHSLSLSLSLSHPLTLSLSHSLTLSQHLASMLADKQWSAVGDAASKQPKQPLSRESTGPLE